MKKSRFLALPPLRQPGRPDSRVRPAPLLLWGGDGGPGAQHRGGQRGKEAPARRHGGAGRGPRLRGQRRAPPCSREHSIQWIYLQTANGGQRKALKPGDDPSVTFRLGEGDEPVAVYAYCNLHGLWATEL